MIRAATWTPHAYQREAIELMLRRATAGLFLAPGLGKTSIVLSAFKLLKAKGIINRMLVVAPLRAAHHVWPKEIARWAEFQHLKYAVLHGPRKDAILKQGLADDVDVLLINPDGLEWLVRQGWKTLGLDMLVVDESTMFKHTTTRRFRLLKPWLTGFRRRYILTGSPAPNGLLDLYGQMYLIDLGSSLGPTYYAYRSKYFDPAGYMGYEWVPRKDTADKVYEAIRPLVLRLDESELKDLPPLRGVRPTPLVVEVDLPPKAARQYKQMEKLLIMEVERGVVQAANSAAAYAKCRQIANGGVYTSAPGAPSEWEDLHTAKVEAAQGIVEELQGTPAAIAYEFHHDLARLQEAFGGHTPWLGGGVPPARFREIETAWNAGEIPVLLMQTRSTAHALNLQGTACHVIFLGLTPDLEAYEQLIRRFWRQGQKHPVTVHHISAQGTVDEAILARLASKDKVQLSLLAALKEHLRGKKR